ncbi:MAG: hypothetical protein C5S52_07820 [ANME-2 cluster archaeon]|nr:hypothetical protein [ANME-2 cluster archaeon]
MHRDLDICKVPREEVGCALAPDIPSISVAHPVDEELRQNVGVTPCVTGGDCIGKPCSVSAVSAAKDSEQRKVKGIRLVECWVVRHQGICKCICIPFYVIRAVSSFVLFISKPHSPVKENNLIREHVPVES